MAEMEGWVEGWTDGHSTSRPLLGFSVALAHYSEVGLSFMLASPLRLQQMCVTLPRRWVWLPWGCGLGVPSSAGGQTWGRACEDGRPWVAGGPGWGPKGVWLKGQSWMTQAM